MSQLQEESKQSFENLLSNSEKKELEENGLPYEMKELENKRMAKIAKLIPHWNKPVPGLKGKVGYHIDYHCCTVQGCSLSHVYTTWLYDNIYKFDTLSPNNNLDIDNRSKDVTDLDAPQSLLFFFK